MELKSLGLLLAGAAAQRAISWLSWETYNAPHDLARVRFMAGPLPLALGTAILTFGRTAEWEKVGAGLFTSAATDWLRTKLE